MKYKTSELTGALLARAVATACGYRVEKEGREWTVWLPPEATPDASPCHSFGEFGWRPDKNWSHCGQLIDLGPVHLSPVDAGGTFNGVKQDSDGWLARCTEHPYNERGDTPQIAVCRAFVAWKLGDEVEL